MATNVKLFASFLIMAFMISSMVIAIPYSSNSRNEDIDAAIEEMESSNYFTFVLLLNMVPTNLFQGNITFLMPSDKSLSRSIIPPNNVSDLLLRHSIPSPLLFEHFLHLPTNSILPTSNPELTLTVTNSGRNGFSLGNVRIVSPNICTHGTSVRCHGIDGVLDIDMEQPEHPPSLSCPRVPPLSPTPTPTPTPAPAPAPAPLVPPSGLAPSFPPHNETSSGTRPHMELSLTCMVFVWILYSKVVTLA